MFRENNDGDYLAACGNVSVAMCMSVGMNGRSFFFGAFFLFSANITTGVKFLVMKLIRIWVSWHNNLDGDYI